MEELTLDLQSPPDPADIKVVAAGLDEVLAAELGSRRREPFAVTLRRSEGSLAGGIVGKVLFGDLHIDQLWLHESARGRGQGRRLMEAAEAHGVRAGCRIAFLNTSLPEAVEFYLRMSYFEIGRVADFPVGHTLYFLRKDLEGGTPDGG